MDKQRVWRAATRAIVVWFGLGLLGACAGDGVGDSVLARADAGCHALDHPSADDAAVCEGSAAIGHGGRSEGWANGQVRANAGVPLQQSGGTFLVPVTINDTVEMPFIVDSGASDVTIPADVVTILMRTGSISDGDFLGKRTYRLADGSTVPTPVFRIRSVKVGDRVLENVTGSVALGSGGLLLGQSFLGRLRSWSIDNERKVLVLD